MSLFGSAGGGFGGYGSYSTSGGYSASGVSFSESFSKGLVTPENRETPSWIEPYVFYVKGDANLGLSSDGDLSVGSLSAGMVDVTFSSPKLLTFFPDDHPLNTNLYTGIGVWNLNASAGIGFSGSFEAVSWSCGVQVGDSVKVGAKAYFGAGFTADFSDGIKFGGGFPFGFVISIDFDW